ncbi:TMEM165/GDT1 family protein [Bdellovibrio bacteriovorus]|uniref:TMEM165/GDT1 family protein n=1 Tax=Bdellovibrio bacteriovorus TaxID=959 RepID=UPI0021D23C96|nr:TMEM165/GDT1 family protein [Bdellovibrio bacteriovorus]UXR64412.1 TMEM165/GDT1 family protein [Bdellovibrio bacteriovorus]
MEAIINSFLLVAATEMGDKTQLLALVLASKYKKPWHVMGGIFVATVLNHALAAWAGEWIAATVPSQWLSWALALTFFGFALWILIPDKDDSDTNDMKWGAFWTTTVLFFFAEIGDKTQLSTVALAAKYQSLTLVTLGTTMGMMFADGLAVVFGEKLTQRISMKWINYGSSALYVLFGVGILMR